MNLKAIFFAITITLAGLFFLNSCKSVPQKSPGSKSIEITEKYWKLVELNGENLNIAENPNREPHLVLKNEGNLLTGNGGCNRISGSYELKDENGIVFSKVVATRMACLNLELETKFLEAINKTETYEISPAGDTLSLKNAESPNLAKFVAIYL